MKRVTLGKYNYYTEAGYFEMIDKIFMLFTFSVIIFGQIIAPKKTALYAKKKYDQLLESYLKVVGVTFIFGIIILEILSPQ